MENVFKKHLNLLPLQYSVSQQWYFASTGIGEQGYINAQISNQNNIDDLHETLACLSTGFIYGRNRCDHTQHFKTVESYPQ